MTVVEMFMPRNLFGAFVGDNRNALGDVLLSGTPANSRPMTPGDTVEVEVTNIGRLSNRVQEVPAPAHKVGHEPTDSDAVRRVALGQF